MQFAAKGGVKADVVQQALDVVAGVREVAQARKVFKILARGPRRLALAGLVADQADEPAHGQRVLPHVVPPQPGRARARRQQRGQHADGGRLARAVKAEEAVEVALGDAEGYAIHGRKVAEAAGEAIHLHCEVAHRVRLQRMNPAPRQSSGNSIDAAPIW
jgi:hypothetical protein